MTIKTDAEIRAEYEAKGFNIRGLETTWEDPRDLWTPDEQEEECCREIPDHDICIDEGKIEVFDRMTEEMMEEFGLDYKSDTEILNEWKKKLGTDNVKIETTWVGPDGHCGEIHTEWDESLGCCDFPPELLKYAGAGSVSPGEDYLYSVVSTSGTKPYQWTAKGAGLSMSGSGADGRLFVDDCFCKPGLVVASDACVVALWIVSRVGGTWTDIDDEVFGSDYGWMQDGVLHTITVHGFNNDRTKHSWQGYDETFISINPPPEPDDIEAIETVLCALNLAQQETVALAVPNDLEGFKKCDNTNIWWRDEIENLGAPGRFHIYYPNGAKGTEEFEHPCMDNPLEYDQDNSGEILADDSSVAVYWTGGELPFDVSVGGQEVYLDSAKTKTEITTGNQGVTIYSKDTCGSITVTITDKCGSSVTGYLRAADGQWVQRYYGSSIEGCSKISQAGYEGGCPITAVDDNECGTNQQGYVTGEFFVTDWKLDVAMEYTNWGGSASGLFCEENEISCWSSAPCSIELSKAEAVSNRISLCNARKSQTADCLQEESNTNLCNEQTVFGNTCVEGNFYLEPGQCDFVSDYNYGWNPTVPNNPCENNTGYIPKVPWNPGFYAHSFIEVQTCDGSCTMSMNYQSTRIRTVTLQQWVC